MKTRSTTMREMSLDGITAKVKVKAAAAAKNLVMYVLCPLSMCAAVCSCSGQPDENVTVLTEKQVLDGAAEVVPDTVCSAGHGVCGQGMDDGLRPRNVQYGVEGQVCSDGI